MWGAGPLSRPAGRATTGPPLGPGRARAVPRAWRAAQARPGASGPGRHGHGDHRAVPCSGQAKTPGVTTQKSTHQKSHLQNFSSKPHVMMSDIVGANPKCCISCNPTKQFHEHVMSFVNYVYLNTDK